MITPGFVDMMAKYNHWQNTNLMSAADALDDAARELDRGSFFRSISSTFNHILWGDRIWLSRFTNVPGPTKDSILKSVDETVDWQEFKLAREEQDQRILTWASAINDQDLEGELSWYSWALEREFSKPTNICITHFFNHQTHHRGQIHAMLTAAGQRPGDTDLPFMPGL